MLVVVVAVSGVAVPLMHVVHVVAMRDGDVSTAFAVDMLMGAVSRVRGCLAFVEVAIMGAVYVALMHVVNVIAVRDSDVTTAFAVDVLVAGMFNVGSRHELLLFYMSRANAHAQTPGVTAFCKP